MQIRTLKEFAYVAANRLTLGLTSERNQRKGEIYFLGDESYLMAARGGNGFIAASGCAEMPYPEDGRLAFIKKSLESGRCAGFVPASQVVQKQLEDLKMKPHAKKGVVALWYPETAAD